MAPLPALPGEFEEMLMASSQSAAVSKLYQGWATAMTTEPGWTMQDQRDLVEAQWPSLATEPGGVDYAEVTVDGRATIWAVPHGSTSHQVLLCIHGGGFISGSVYTHRKLYAHLAKTAGVRALIISYPLLPTVFPAQVEATTAAYRWLLDQDVAASDIVVAGDSVGGGLAVTTQLLAREAGLPLPAGTLLISPGIDQEATGESMVANDGRDALLNQYWVRQMAADFLSGASPRDPHANPLHADLAGIAPIYIQVGDQEVLLDDSRMLAEAAERAGVEVRLDIFAEQQHTFQMMVGRAPEADDAVARLAAWTRTRLNGDRVAA